METLENLRGIEDLTGHILSYFTCDMEKGLSTNYWNFCVQTVNKYLNMFEFFHKAIMVDPEPTANQQGMYPGEPAHKHQAMVDFISDSFESEELAKKFYRRLERILKTMFNGVSTENLLNVGIYSEEMNILRRSTNSIRIQEITNENRTFLDDAYLMNRNWNNHYEQVLEEEAPYGY